MVNYPVSSSRPVRLNFPQGFAGQRAPLDSPELLAAFTHARGQGRQPPSPTLPALKQRADSWVKAQKVPEVVYGTRLEEQFQGWLEGVIRDVQSRNLRADSWQNMLTGHGTGRDKATATLFQQEGQLDFPTLEALYHNEDLAARIIDAEPEQMFREGFDVKIEDSSDEEDDFEDALRDLGANDAFEEAAIWSRLYGGGAVFVGAQDGKEPQEPLAEDGIQSVDFLQVIDRYSLWPNTWYGDPDKPGFGQPETYRIFTPTVAGVTPPVNVIIHESRLITFPGARTSIRKRRVNFGWQDSVLQRPYQVLMQFGLSWTAATHLLSDAAQGVYKVKNLLDMISGQNKEALLDRMAVLDMSRSTARMMMVDSENESFERTATPFTGVPEMLDRITQRLAAAARMPVTVLMGMSPAGLNATGESDMRQWYDRIRTVQNHIAKPRVQKLVRILMLAKEGPTDGKELPIGIHFRPLWQSTANEEADRRLKVAQADDIYLGYGVVQPEEVRQSRFGGEGYNPETTVEGEITDDALKATAQAAQAVKGEHPDLMSNDPRTGVVGGPGVQSMPNQAAPTAMPKPKAPKPSKRA